MASQNEATQWPFDGRWLHRHMLEYDFHITLEKLNGVDEQSS